MGGQRSKFLIASLLLLGVAGAARGDESDLKAKQEALRKVKTPEWFSGANWETATRLDQAVMAWLNARSGAKVERSQFDMRSSFEDGRSESMAARQAKAKLLSNPSNRPDQWSPGMQQFEQGLNAFHYLAAMGLSDAMEELALKSPDMGRFDKDDYGNTSLDYAAVYGRAEVIRILQNKHQMVPNLMGCSRPLCLAAAMGHAEAARELLREVPAPMNKDDKGKTALDYAIESGDQATIDVLQSKSLNHPGLRKGMQPLKAFRGPVLSAIDNGRVDALRSLARNVRLTDDLQPEHRNMFDPKNRDSEEEDEFFESGKRNNSEAASTYIPRGTKLLHYAAAHSTPEVAEFLIKSVKIEASSFDENGDPPLFFAESAKMAEFLIREDPSLLEHTNAKDQTVAHVLALRTSGEALKLILQKRPELLAAKDAEGRTPIEIAVEANSPNALTVLLEAGADPKLVVKDGSKANGIAKIIHDVVVEGKASRSNSTLLHVAAQAGAKETAKILIARGFDLNAMDDFSRTPLIVSLVENQPDFAKWHLHESEKTSHSKTRVDVNAAAKNGCRAIHYAAASGDAEIVQKLIDQGAEVNAPVGESALGAVLNGCGGGFQSGLTPFDLARAGPHWKALNVLKKAGAKGSGISNNEE